MLQRLIPQQTTTGQLPIVLTSFEEIKTFIKNKNWFEFNASNLILISGLTWFIDQIYQKTFLYLASGNFLETNIKEILQELKSLNDRFANANTWSSSSDEFLKFIRDIKLIESDFQDLEDLKIDQKWKREDLPSLSNGDDTSSYDEDEHVRNDRKIFRILLRVYENAYSDTIISRTKLKYPVWWLLESLQEIQSLRREDFPDNYMLFVEECMYLSLFKLSLIGREHIFSYIVNGHKIGLNIQQKIGKTHFKEQSHILEFLSGTDINEVNFQKIIHTYENDLETKTISHLWIKVLLRHYQDVTGSTDWLEKLFNFYKDFINNNSGSTEENERNHMNVIYIWNTYLSLLISYFSKTNNSDTANKIESVHSELIKFSKCIANRQYRNYFTTYKYAIFRRIQLEKKVSDFSISLKQAQEYLGTVTSLLQQSLRQFNSIHHHVYFEFHHSDFLAQNDILSQYWIQSVFFPNLFTLPYDASQKRKTIENELRELEHLEWDLRYKENFSEINDKIEKSKLDVISVVGIFTGLVVYSIWTIQIFAVIETVWSAWLFAWIFLSWILLLLGWIYYRVWIPKKLNKWLHLICLWLIVLVVSFIWKICLDSEPLNGNKGEDTYEKLNLKVQEAKQLKETLDERVKNLEKLQNNNINNNKTSSSITK